MWKLNPSIMIYGLKEKYILYLKNYVKDHLKFLHDMIEIIALSEIEKLFKKNFMGRLAGA